MKKALTETWRGTGKTASATGRITRDTGLRATGCFVCSSLLLSFVFFLAGVCPRAFANLDSSPGAATGIEELELVESIPIETSLDNADIRNTHEVWLEMLEGAKSTLELEEFYVSDAPGEPLEDILNAIGNAAHRGVMVRFIADARMYQTYPERLDWLSEQKNIEVRTIDMASISGGVMHAKYFIVDKTEVFLGSQNFDWRALKHIHEIGCRVKGREFARVFSNLFELDWKLSRLAGKKLSGPGSGGSVAAGARQGGSRGKVSPSLKRELQRAVERYRWHYRVPLRGIVDVPYPHGRTLSKYGSKDTVEVWPVYSPEGFIPDRDLWDEHWIVALIDSARHEVDVQVLTYSSISNKSYFSALDDALRRAASRGVLIKFIASDWSKDHPEIDCLKSLSLFPNVGVELSTIPEWSGGFVPYARVEHCKYMVIDDKLSWIGSSNWEKDYFHYSRNVGLVIKSAALAEMLREVFYKSWDSEYAYGIRPDVQYTPPKRGE